MTFSSGLLLSVGMLVFSTAVAHAAETLSERRERVESMTPEEKEALRQKQDRFVSLPAAEQERIRKLHDQLAVTNDAGRLQGVLERYHGWLATLSSAQRAELLSLPADKRLAKIKELMHQQEEQRFRQLVENQTAKLTAEDRTAIEKWLGDFVLAHKQEILDSIPREFRPRNEGEERMRGSLMMALVWRWANEAEKVPRPQPEDIDVLMAALSTDAKKVLEGVRGDPANRQKLAQEWVRAAIMSRRWRPEPVSAEELRKFYAEKLSATEREKLEALPPEEMKVQLQRQYYEHQFRGRGGPPWQGRGPNDGPRRGDRDRDRNDKKGPPPNGRPFGDGPPGEPPPPPDESRPPLDKANSEY